MPSSASSKSAQCAEAPFDQNAYISHLADASLQSACRSEANDTPSGFLTLRDICFRIRRSRSWAYENAIVPLTDCKGKVIEPRRKPRFPWLPLPQPRIPHGKRLWAEADYNRWHEDICARANPSPKVSTLTACTSAKVTA